MSIEKSGVFSVSVLPVTVPMELSGQFGFKSGRDLDKFAETEGTVLFVLQTPRTVPLVLPYYPDTTNRPPCLTPCLLVSLGLGCLQSQYGVLRPRRRIQRKREG